mgnify:CR=1 FL=1
MKAKKSKQEVQEVTTLINDFSDENIEKRVTAAQNVVFIADVPGAFPYRFLVPLLEEGL